MEPPETEQMQMFIENLIAMPFENSNGLFGAISIIPIIFFVLKRIRKAGN